MQTLTLLALSTLFLLPPQPVEDNLAWNPAPSPSLRRTVNVSSASTVDEPTLLLMGDERDAGTGMERTRDFKIVTLERYAASKGEQPIRFVCVYESVREGKGELLWDMEGGHLASLVFTVGFETTLDAAWSMAAGGMDLDLETSNSESGQLRLEINAECVE